MFIGKVLIHEMLTGVRNDFANVFLDASTHLYMRVCPSVRGPSVRPWSVVRFFLIAEIDKKHHRIIGKVETLSFDCNHLQKTFKTNFKTKF